MEVAASSDASGGEFAKFSDAMRRILSVKPEQIKAAKEQKRKHVPAKKRGRSKH